MTTTAIDITEDEFGATYPLRPNHLNPDALWATGDGRGCLFETYGEELAFVHRQDPRTLWTILAGDDGEVLVVSGYRYVNRIGYLLSAVPVPNGQSIQLRIPADSETGEGERV